MKPKVGIIGRGNVGGALERGLRRAGYDVLSSGSDPAEAHRAAANADIVVLAVPYGAVDGALASVRDAIEGKTVIDVINPLTEDLGLAVGHTTSAAEELQKKAPAAHVVKAFNTVFAQHMGEGRLDGQPLSIFAAGDDDRAKAQVLKLASDIGFDAVDAGPLKNARSLEALAQLNVQLGYGLGQGTEQGFVLVR